MPEVNARPEQIVETGMSHVVRETSCGLSVRVRHRGVRPAVPAGQPTPVATLNACEIVTGTV